MNSNTTQESIDDGENVYNFGNESEGPRSRKRRHSDAILSPDFSFNSSFSRSDESDTKEDSKLDQPPLNPMLQSPADVAHPAHQWTKSYKWVNITLNRNWNYGNYENGGSELTMVQSMNLKLDSSSLNKGETKATDRSNNMSTSAGDGETFVFDDADYVPSMQINRVIQNLRVQLATDSSVRVISLNPDTSQVLFCISAMMQAQISDFRNATMESKMLHPIFMLKESDVMQDAGHSGAKLVVDVEAHKVKLQDNSVPSIAFIYRTMIDLQSRTNYASECNILALVYLNRILSTATLVVTSYNWYSIWVVLVMLAQKMWDDNPLSILAFSTALPGCSKRHLAKMEVHAMKLLEFNMSVAPSLYAKYYFELRQLLQVAIGMRAIANTEGSKRDLNPLTQLQASQLIARLSGKEVLMTRKDNDGSAGSTGSSSRTSKSRSSRSCKATDANSSGHQ